MHTQHIYKRGTFLKSRMFILFLLVAAPYSLLAQCPPITTTVNNSSCTSGASLTLSATTYGSQYVGQGVRHRWYTSSTGTSYVQDVAATDNTYAGFTSSSYTANFSSTTSYWVAAYKTGCSMSSRRQVTATINSGSATISPSTSPTNVCSADGITLTANSGTSYKWYRTTINTFSTSNQVSTSRTYSPTTYGYYWVQVYNSPCGWTTSSSIHVTFVQAVTPSVSISKSPSGDVCPGTSVTLTANPQNTTNTPSYSWTIGGSNYTTNPVNYTVNSNTSVSLTMTSNDACVTTSTANASTSLSIYPYPTSGTLQGTGTYCEGTSGASLSVSSTQSGYKYYLYRGATLVQTVTGTGGTVSFSVQTTEGTYTLKGSHASCVNDKTTMSGSVVVDMLPYPTQGSLTGTGSYCEGTSGSTMSVSNSQSGYKYYLYRGATLVQTVTGNGGSVSFNAQTTAGTYTLKGSNASCTSYKTTMTGSVVVSMLPYPTSGSLQGTGTYCDGSSGAEMSVSSSQSGYKYYLYRGATLVETITGNGGTASFSPQLTEGTYTLQASNASCTSYKISMSGSVVVDLLPLTTVSLTSSSTPAEACQGDGLKLTATASRTIQSVTWKRGTTTVSTDNSSPFEYTPNTTGTYTYYAEILVDNGCGTNYTETESMGVTINAIEDLNVTVSGPGTICSGTSGDFSAAVDNNLGSLVDYQWYMNDSPVGSNSSSYNSTTLDHGDVVKCTVTLQSASTCASPSSDWDQVSVELYDPEGLASSSSFTSMRTTEGVLMAISSPQADMTYYLYQQGNATAVDTNTYANRNMESGFVEFDLQSTETTYTSKATLAQCPSLQFDVPGSVILSQLAYYPPVEVETYSRSLSSTQNYTRVVTAKESGHTNSILSETDPYEVSEAIAYSDGLGRTIQTSSIAANPSGKDIIQFTEYDDMGRTPKNYLPYVDLKSSLGKYRDSTIIYQSDFYDGTEDFGLSLTDVDTTGSPFAESLFDDTQSSTVLELGAAGESWQLGSTFDSDGHSDGHTVKSKWESNAIVMSKWEINSSGIVYALEKSIYGYLADELTIRIAEDENESSAENYVNKEGQLVYSKRFNGDDTLITINVYDEMNRLRYVLPPELSDRVANDSLGYEKYFRTSDLDIYAYQYEYDARGRLVEKKLPGIEPVYYIYDNRNRLALSQDGNLRNDNQWSFIKYDELNRPVLSGIVTKNYTRSVMQDTLDLHEGDYLFEERYSAGTHDYTNRAYPDISSATVYAVNYYDDYDFIDDFSQDTLFAYHQLHSSYAADADYRVYGRPTGGKIKMIGENQWLQSALYYDQYGRVLSTIRDLYPDGYEISNVKYKFNGQVEQTTLLHTPDDSDITLINQRYEYDHQGRILEQYHQIDDQDEVLLQAFLYNELGQLVEKNIFCPDSTEFLQSVDFEYNIRGWLKTINEGVPGGDDGDLFVQELQYEDPDSFNADTLYNGMVSATTWWQSNNDTLSAYGYDYDDLYQLKAADFHIKDGTWSDSEAYNISNLSYDKNGNLETVNRYGSEGIIDNLNYTYTGNQLKAVGDQAGDQTGRGDFYDGTDGSATQEYAYDDNGNMTSDSNKGITSITYNFLNLPESIDFGSGDKINYIYDAAGKRWKTVIEESGSATDSTIYMGGFVYNNNTLSFAQTATGRIVPDGADYRYDHYLKDHLGSTRVVFSDTDNDGDPEVLQETHFYPFGLEMNDRSYLSGLDNSYLYTGKSIDEQHGLDWYALGARYFDPQLARWHATDPLAELFSSFSAYNYVINNPVNFIDPNGMSQMSAQVHNQLDAENGGVYYNWEMANKMAGMMGSQFGGTSEGNKYSGNTGSGIEVGTHFDWKTGKTYKVYEDPFTGERYYRKQTGTKGWDVDDGSELGAACGSPTYSYYSLPNADLDDEDISYWDFIRNTDFPEPIMGMPPAIGIGKIGTYVKLAKLTKGYKGVIQAHHLIEVRHLKRLMMSIKKSPAVILTKADHAALTKTLQQLLPYGNTYTRSQLINAYKQAYSNYPEWVNIIVKFLK